MLGKGQVVALGAYDAMTSRLAEKCGAGAIYVSGFAGAAARLGRPDLGLMTQTEMSEHIQRICEATTRPVLADADTGYGGALNVQRTVRLWERAGCSGLHIEDQMFPKRCGHVAGKLVVPVEEMEQKLRAAADARDDKNFLLIARTDAVAVEGIEAAIERCKRYSDTGVDGFFVDAPETIDQIEEISKQLAPLGRILLFNSVRTFKSPILSATELAKLGFGLIIFPVDALLTAYRAIEETYRTLLRTGSTDDIAEKMVTFSEFNQFIGLSDNIELELKFST